MCESSGGECFSITITGSTFSKFGFMKSTVTQAYLVPEELGLKFHAFILHLTNYSGALKIEGNNFEDNIIKYKGCEILNLWNDEEY